MMRVCARTGDIEKANQFWQAMIRSGAIAFAALINQCLTSAGKGVTPPAKAFAVIMEVHGRVGDVRKAQQLFDV